MGTVLISCSGQQHTLTSHTTYTISASAAQQPANRDTVTTVLGFTVPAKVPVVRVRYTVPITVYVERGRRPGGVDRGVFGAMPPMFDDAFLPTKFDSSA